MRSRILSTQRASERERGGKKKSHPHSAARCGCRGLACEKEGGGVEVERKEGDERKVDERQEGGKRKGRGHTLVFLLAPHPVSVDISAWCHRCLGPAGILSAASPAAPFSASFLWLFSAGRENLPKIKDGLMSIIYIFFYYYQLS